MSDTSDSSSSSSGEEADATCILPPKYFPHFRVERFIAKGAYGSVHVLRNIVTKDQVACKVIRHKPNDLSHRKEIEEEM